MNKLIRLARPFTLGHTIIISLAYCSIAGFDFKTTILATYSLLAMHAFAQMTNLLFDRKIDKINKPWRPTVTSEVKLHRAIIFDLFCMISALAIAHLIGDFFFTMMVLLWFFAFGFTAFPVRKNQFTHVFWMATTRGFIPAYMITQNVYIAILMFLWNCAFNPTKDYKDVKGDLMYGIKTIVNQFGKSVLIEWMCTWGAMFYATLLGFCLACALPMKALVCFATLPLAYAIPRTLDEPPAFSDNNLAYDTYWFGFTLNSVLLAVAIS